MAASKRVKYMNVDGGVLKAGTKVDLPIWLGIALAQRDIVQMRIPSYLSKKYQDVLKAGSEVVNFRSQSCNIYENTLKLCSYYDEEAVSEFLNQYRDAFIARFTKLIYDLADSTEMQQNDQFTHDLKRMSNLEREIFDLHKRQRIAFNNFKNKV
jgi:hypothetical protein